MEGLKNHSVPPGLSFGVIQGPKRSLPLPPLQPYSPRFADAMVKVTGPLMAKGFAVKTFAVDALTAEGKFIVTKLWWPR